MIDAIPAMAWCSLPDGSVEFANQRWHDYTGLSDEDLRGWEWKVAVHPDDLEAVTGKWQALLASKQPKRFEEHAARIGLCVSTVEPIVPARMLRRSSGHRLNEAHNAQPVILVMDQAAR